MGREEGGDAHMSGWSGIMEVMHTCEDGVGGGRRCTHIRMEWEEGGDARMSGWGGRKDVRHSYPCTA